MHTLESILEVGKYKGKTIKSVIFTDFKYIKWCINNIKGFTLDDESNQYLIKTENSQPSPYKPTISKFK